MPNHITNILTIGADEEQVKGILEHIKSDQYGLGSIDFNKLIPMPESLLQTESSSRSERALKLYRSFMQDSADIARANVELSRSPDEQRLAASALLRKYQELTEDDPELLRLGRQCYENLQNYGHTDWYRWAIAIWGTKWTAYGFGDPDTFHEGDTLIRFLTAWSAPHPVLHKLSEMYPDVTFSHRWADEDFGCNVGEREYLGGGVISENIPMNGSVEAYEMAADIMDIKLHSEESGYYLSADGSGYLFMDGRVTYELIELFGDPALFTNDRVAPSEIPKGLYCCDLRFDDDGSRIAAIEPHADINHAGSVITKEPVDFGEAGYIVFTEDTSPNFLGGQITLPQYMNGDFKPDQELNGGMEL